MKFPKFSFNKEMQQLHEFESLSPSEHSIVFYAEDKFAMIHFEQILNELTKNLGRKICYITSSSTDPILNTENQMIKPFYIGDGTVRTKFFLTLKADVLVMTMPDLETFHIKKSKIHPVHYVYIFHSLVSTHMVYRKGAFDNFDTILCGGKHQIREIRETEKIYQLKPKNLLEHGYDRIDTLIKNSSTSELPSKYKKNVLIAPSWGQHALLENHGKTIIQKLLENNYNVVVRPHPVIINKSPKMLKSLKENFENNSKFTLELDIQNTNSLHNSQFLISDWSGIAIEFAFSQGRPVLYIDVPKKINNSDFEKIPITPLEEHLREKLGYVLHTDQLHKIPEKLEFLYQNRESFKKQIFDIRSDTIFNIGKSGEIGAKHIAKIADEQHKN